MKPKIHTISSERNFKLVGIASHLTDYKLSWLLNEHLNFKFQQSNDLIIEENNPAKFSIYEFESENNTYYTLIANRAEMAILIKSLKNIDYILKIEGNTSQNEMNILIEKIKKLQNILTVFEIDQKNIKAKELELL